MADASLFRLSRRGFLCGAAGAASLAALPTATLAAGSGDNRLVVLILRGGMDGVDLVQPHGDPGLVALRPGMALSPDADLLDLDGFFGLHPAASDLMGLWQAGELGFVHAVASSYRGQKHFEAQDVLETAEAEGKAGRTGWLNRALSLMPRIGQRRAVDITAAVEPILSGPNLVDVWAARPDRPLANDEMHGFGDLFAGDAAFAASFQDVANAGPGGLFDAAARRAGLIEMARQVGAMLNGDYRVASFSLEGWDTHVDQRGQFPQAAGDLSAAILALREGMGPAAWSGTIVLALTEFGRSLRLNDRGGTDHGGASCALLAGGGLSGSGLSRKTVMGRWPGLAPEALYEGRALMPTGDVRDVAAAVLHRQFDITPANITSKVFPGLAFDGAASLLQAG